MIQPPTPPLGPPPSGPAPFSDGALSLPAARSFPVGPHSAIGSQQISGGNRRVRPLRVRAALRIPGARSPCGGDLVWPSGWLTLRLQSGAGFSNHPFGEEATAGTGCSRDGEADAEGA